MTPERGSRTLGHHDLVALALLVASCGGGAPTTPDRVVQAPPTPEPTPRTFSIVSAETRSPVAGATVTIAGTAVTSDATGVISVPAMNLQTGTLVDIDADGFLDRQTTLGAGTANGAFSLWPITSPTGLTRDITARLVYTSALPDEADAVGQQPLTRWVAAYSDIDVFLGEGFDPSVGRAVDFQVEAVRAINSLPAGSLNYRPPVFGEPSQPNRYVVISIDSGDESCRTGLYGALTYWRRYDSGELGAIDIVYCSRGDAENFHLALHELGHSLGLEHSGRRGDVMSFERDASGAFTPAEVLIVDLMYQRRAGNRFPDNDREALGDLGRSSIEVIACLR